VAGHARANPREDQQGDPDRSRGGSGARPRARTAREQPADAVLESRRRKACRRVRVIDQQARASDVAIAVLERRAVPADAVEVVGDLLDVLADLGALVADEIPALVTGDPGDVGCEQDTPRPRPCGARGRRRNYTAHLAHQARHGRAQTLARRHLGGDRRRRPAAYPV